MATKMGIPCEFKYELAMKGWASMLAGFLYVIRDEFGATTALRLIETLFKRDDRVKNLTNFIKNVFKIEGNDIEAINKWFDIYHELSEPESVLQELHRVLTPEGKLSFSDHHLKEGADQIESQGLFRLSEKKAGKTAIYIFVKS